MRRLILWDIDGTLVHTGGVGARAIEAGATAAAALLEAPVVPMSGKTDPQILREIFVAAEMTEDRVTEVLPRALAEVERALAAAEADLRDDGRVLPGVLDALAALRDLGGVRQSVVTGNLVANAALKLAAFDLTAFLDLEVGAYGSDHADRKHLVPVALERSSRLRGEHYRSSEVWVIGDTANDLACARAAGVRCLLVGTGSSGPDAVRRLDADAILPDLSDTEEVLRILTSG